LGVDLSQRFGRARARGRCRSKPSQRDLHVAGLQLPVLAGVYEIDRPQIPDDRFRIDKGGQRVESLGGIVGVIGLEQRVDPIPVALKEAVNDAEPRGKSRNAFRPSERRSQVHGHPEVLGAKQQGLSELDYLWPARVLGGLDGVTDALLRLAPRRLLELKKRKVVLEIGSARG